MAEPLIYVDVAEVREGVLVDLRQAIAELAEFVEETEPQLVSYNAYFSDDAVGNLASLRWFIEWQDDRDDGPHKLDTGVRPPPPAEPMVQVF